MENLINKLFPIKCYFCGYFGKPICNKCLNEFSPIFSTNCIGCDQQTNNGFTHENCKSKATYLPDASLSLFEYDGYVRECITTSKYKTKQFILLRYLTKYGIHNLLEAGAILEADYIIPIPLSKAKRRQRGFNQSKIICDIVSKTYNIKTKTNLKRVVNTKAQFSKSRVERFNNVKNAFYIRWPQQLKGKSVILVDDILTSGATMIEATKTLKKAGVKTVFCFTLSKKQMNFKSTSIIEKAVSKQYYKPNDKFYLPSFKNSKIKAVA